MKHVSKGASSGVSDAGLFQEHVFGAPGDLDFQGFGTIWSIWGAVLESIGFRRVSPLGVSRGFRHSRQNMYF